jgi:hypothetical protein
MTCSRCGKTFGDGEAACPHCGEPNAAGSGVFQTSTVLISGEGGEQVFRSVEEVPVALRTKLLKSTNSSNSATILIADRKGRRELAKAMRNLPGPAQRRLRSKVLGENAEAGKWLTPARRRLLLAVLVLIALFVIAAVFARGDGAF